MNSFKKILRRESMKKRIIGILSAAMVVLLSTPLAGCGGIKEKDADWVELSTWFFTSGVPNNVIEIVTDNEEAELLCTVKMKCCGDIMSRNFVNK